MNTYLVHVKHKQITSLVLFIIHGGHRLLTAQYAKAIGLKCTWENLLKMIEAIIEQGYVVVSDKHNFFFFKDKTIDEAFSLEKLLCLIFYFSYVSIIFWIFLR